ncbi:hypothetical protein BsWGS_18213 [Bradybaena similaris]
MYLKFKIAELEWDPIASTLDSVIGSKKRKTMRNGKDLKLEKVLYLWFVQRSKEKPKSGCLSCGSLFQFNNQRDRPPDFKASEGWFRNFNSRQGIRELEIQEESFSSNATGAENFKETLLLFWKKKVIHSML